MNMERYERIKNTPANIRFLSLNFAPWTIIRIIAGRAKEFKPLIIDKIKIILISSSNKSPIDLPAINPKNAIIQKIPVRNNKIPKDSLFRFPNNNSPIPKQSSMGRCDRILILKP